MSQNTNETWIKLEDGTMQLIASETIEVKAPTIEELIAQAEAELAQKYSELLALRADKN